MNIAHPGSATVGPRAQRAGGQLGTASVQEQHQAGAPSLLFLYSTLYSIREVMFFLRQEGQQESSEQR